MAEQNNKPKEKTTKELLQEDVKFVFENYPKEDELIVFDDGNIFLMKNSNLAENYKRASKLQFKVVKRSELK